MGVAEKCNYIRIDLDTAENEPRQVAENVSNPRFEERAGREIRYSCDNLWFWVDTARESLHYFIDFMSEASVDWGRIVVAKPASPVFMISPQPKLNFSYISIELIEMLRCNFSAFRRIH